MTRPEREDSTRAEREPVTSLAAFEEVMKQHLPWVVDLAESILRDPGVAEDIAQRTFIKLWEGMSEGKVGNDCRPWLRRVALNLCRKHIRDEGRNEARLEEAMRARESDFPFFRPGVGSAEWRLMIEKASELPPQQRLAFTLVNVKGLSFDQAAKCMGVAAASVRRYARRAYATLRKRFREELERRKAAWEAAHPDGELE